MENKCLIIDGNNLLHSSYHVAQKMSWKITNGTIFFFLRVLISLLKKDNYQKLLITFDGGGTNWRETVLPEYKAQRITMPDELIGQMRILTSLLEQTKLPFLQLKDCEADDVIASFVEQNKKIYPDVVFNIFTRDKDLLQLIGPRVNILKYIEGKITLYTVEHFQQEYHFPPGNYVDYLSLIGDNVDNISGVKGIGPVNAQKLIQQFGSIENIYQKISEIPESTKNLLENQAELLQKNKKIISLISNLSLPDEQYKNCNFDWSEWKDNEQLGRFCQENGFKSILRLLDQQLE